MLVGGEMPQTRAARARWGLMGRDLETACTNLIHSPPGLYFLFSRYFRGRYRVDRCVVWPSCVKEHVFRLSLGT